MDKSNLFDVTNARILITGGSSGIGLAIAEAFCANGAKVIIASENATACKNAVKKIEETGGNISSIVCDLSMRSETEKLANHMVDKLGGIDVLICSAGIEGPVGPIGTCTTEELHRLFAINLESVVWLSGLLSPVMAKQGGGSVILISSISGVRGNGAIGSYAMTKAAIAQLARNLAVEWGSQNIRANSISPGLIRTAFSEKLMEDTNFMKRRLQATPLRRAGETPEIAGAAVFLASPAGAFMTGQNLIIDGGTVISDGS